MARYKLVLHPLNVSWDPDRERVYGNMTLSNVHTEPGTNVSLFGFRLDIGGRGLSYASAQTPEIEAGETFVLNYSIQRDDGNGSRPLNVRVSYEYMETPPQTGGSGDVWYQNECLRLHPNGSVTTTIETEPVDARCNPWSPGLSRYGMNVHTVDVPPVELWSEWETIDEGWSRPLASVQGFLEDFSYREANVTYFDGRISCFNCNWCYSPTSGERCTDEDMSR